MALVAGLCQLLMPASQVVPASLPVSLTIDSITAFPPAQATDCLTTVGYPLAPIELERTSWCALELVKDAVLLLTELRRKFRGCPQLANSLR